jgi:hypothetical protein
MPKSCFSFCFGYKTWGKNNGAEDSSRRNDVRVIALNGISATPSAEDAAGSSIRFSPYADAGDRCV